MGDLVTVIRRLLIVVLWCGCVFMVLATMPYTLRGGEWGALMFIMFVAGAPIGTVLINWILDGNFKFYFNSPRGGMNSGRKDSVQDGISTLPEDFQTRKGFSVRSEKLKTIINIFKWSAIVHIGVVAITSMMEYQAEVGWPSHTVYYIGILVRWLSGTVVWGIIFSLLWVIGSWTFSIKSKR